MDIWARVVLDAASRESREGGGDRQIPRGPHRLTVARLPLSGTEIRRRSLLRAGCHLHGISAGLCVAARPAVGVGEQGLRVGGEQPLRALRALRARSGERRLKHPKGPS